MDYQLILLIAIIVIGASMAIDARAKRVRLERRLGLAERKLAQLVQKLAANGVDGMAELRQQPPPSSVNIPPVAFESEANLDEVRYWLEQGKKIQAIKVYREQTRVGLKDAKEAVEAMMGGR